MLGATLLFEPLPIARLGVRRDNDAVILGADFSSFGFILEEFVSLGVHKIAIPESFPEISALSSAPPLLKSRIDIIDDTHEINLADRLLLPLMNELKIEVIDDTGNLKKPPDLSIGLFSAFRQIRHDTKSLALGFNKSVQIELDPNLARSASRALRQATQQPESGAILASIEGLLSYYNEIEFDAVTPPSSAPPAMISLFDRLMNDPLYSEYSEAISTLGRVQNRQSALSRVRTAGRALSSSNLVGKGWNFVARVVNVCAGVPLPKSNTLSILVSNRSFPTVVGLRQARQRALEMWMSSADHTVPYNRSGTPYSNDEVDWLPPLKSISAPQPGESYLRLGNVGELRDQLQAFEKGRSASV